MLLPHLVTQLALKLIAFAPAPPRLVRLPLNKVGSLTKINKALAELEQQYEREPTADELASLLEISPEEVAATMNISTRHVSMDAPFTDGESNSLLDVLENHDTDRTDMGMEYHDSLRKETERTLATLTERERGVLKLFFGIGVEHPMTLQDIGEEFGLTRERVRQIKDKAINKLRATNKCDALKAYLAQ